MPFKRRIYYRIFPTEKINFDLLKIDTKSNKIYVRHLQELAKNAFGKKEPSYWEFATNGVFFNVTQDKVYAEVVADDFLNKIIKGYSGVIISFGQTGTGKSFTASGLHLSEEDFGLAPRLANDLLELKRTRPCNIKMSIQMSYVEFINNSAVDLLEELPNSLVIYKCRDVKKVKVTNEFEALRCLFLGEGRKNFIETNTQYLSNMCSTVVTFHITMKNMDLTNPIKICSRLHVVDLAGNDSCANISGLHKNPKEIGLANVTKSQLEQFILRLSENVPENIRIQQRMNILIYYLDGDLSSENVLRFIGHIKAKSEDMLITLSMLRFGHVVLGLKTRRKQIKFDMNEEVELEFLRKKLDAYDKEKHLNSVLLNIDLVSGLSQPRIAHLNNLIQNYLKNDIGEITVVNVADAQIVLKNIKEICVDTQTELKKAQIENQMLTAQNQSDAASLKHRSSVSKTSSLGSGSKVARKPSKTRSKDSFLKDRVTSVSALSELKPNQDDQGALPEPPITKRKKSRSTSTSVMRPATGKSKKTSNTSINKQDSKTSLPSNPDASIPMPEILPEKKEIWKQYVNHGTYKDRVDDYKANEKDVRESYSAYIKEVKKLHGCKENVNRSCNDLITAQTFRKFNYKDEYDDDGNLITSYAEKQCKASLERSYRTQIEQQEKVLKCQEELKIYLESRQHIISAIDQEFDLFSRDHYKIPSSTSQEIEEDLKEITFAINLERPDYTLDDIEEMVNVPHVPQKTQMIKRLNKLMSEELVKRKRITNEKKHKWKNT